MDPLARRAATLLLAAAGVAVGSCTERLEGGRACPILCPGQEITLRDTLVAAVVLDSTLSGYPATGSEQFLLLAWRPDTLETRVIVRFDTLPSSYTPPSAPTTTVPIEHVENARFRIRLRFPTRFPDRTVTVEAFDVDTAVAGGDGADTTAASMLPLFRPERSLGSLTFAPQDVATEAADSTIAIPVDGAYLLAKIQAKGRLRVGLRLRGDQSGEILFQGVEVGRVPQIAFDVLPGDEQVELTASPYSATPEERFVAVGFMDFVIVAHRRAPDTPAEVLTVGGIPGRRAYLRFELPSGIVDSTSVVRATLQLTQYPNRLAPNGADSVSLYPHPVAASDRVTDLRRAATLLAPIFDPRLRLIFAVDSLRTAPNDSGPIGIEVIGVVQFWRGVTPEQSSRSIVLRLPLEGYGADELYFYSSEAVAELRPRLRIVYAPRLGIGLP